MLEFLNHTNKPTLDCIKDFCRKAGIPTEHKQSIYALKKPVRAPLEPRLLTEADRREVEMNSGPERDNYRPLRAEYARRI